VAIDNGPDRGGEPAGDQVVEAALLGREGLAAGTELQGDELLLPVGENGDHAQDRHAHDCSRAA
jgi:hypothetical protein